MIKNRAYARARYHRIKDDPAYKEQQRKRVRTSHQSLTTSHYRKMTIGLLAQRDGWECWLCHTTTTWDTVSIAHVIPRFLAPDNHDPDNLRLAHRLCNSLPKLRAGGSGVQAGEESTVAVGNSLSPLA